MIQIAGIKLPFDHNDEDLRLAVLKALNVIAGDLISISIKKSSLDARKKTAIRRVYTLQIEVSDEKSVLSKHKNDHNITEAKIKEYQIPALIRKPDLRPIVIGTGPAGLFAGLILAEAGLNPLLIDRGKPVRERTKDTYNFWNNRELNPESNVQFGEGGAGTFSDGKLQTRVKDKAKLVKVVENIRKRIIKLGGEYEFQSRVDDLLVNDNKLEGVKLQNGKEIFSNQAILAIGHSARDTFQMLQDRGVKLEAKPFSVGFRIEHAQELINLSQYGQHAKNPRLGAADYQLAHHSSYGRTVYSFCMCPGDKWHESV